MTTLKKINVLSIILIAATVIGAGLDLCFNLCFNWADNVRVYLDSKASVRNIVPADGVNFVFFLRCLAVLVSAVTAIVAGVMLVINYIGVLRTVRKGNIFTEELERRVSRIGIDMIVIYVSECVMTLVDGRASIEWPGGWNLCCGIGMMIVSQIFALGRQMKEDQEFTV